MDSTHHSCYLLNGCVNEAIKKSRIPRSTIVVKSPNTPFWSKMVNNGRFHLYPIHRTPQEKKTHTPKKITYGVEKERTPFTPSSTVQVTARSSLFRFVNFLQRVVVNQEQLKKQRVETTNATGDGRVCDLANSTDGAMVLGDFCRC